MSRSPTHRLGDICESISRIQSALTSLEIAESHRDYELTQNLYDAIQYRLVVIGEAVKALPASLLEAEPEVPWQSIARLRDLLVHHYHRVDPLVIRQTIEEPLSQLAAAAARLAP